MMVKQRCVLTNITYVTPSAAVFPSSLHTETEMAMPPCQLQRYSSCTRTANVYCPVVMDSRRKKKSQSRSTVAAAVVCHSLQKLKELNNLKRDSSIFLNELCIELEPNITVFAPGHRL